MVCSSNPGLICSPLKFWGSSHGCLESFEQSGSHRHCFYAANASKSPSHPFSFYLKLASPGKPMISGFLTFKSLNNACDLLEPFINVYWNFVGHARPENGVFPCYEFSTYSLYHQLESCKWSGNLKCLLIFLFYYLVYHPHSTSPPSLVWIDVRILSINVR